MKIDRWDAFSHLSHKSKHAAPEVWRQSYGFIPEPWGTPHWLDHTLLGVSEICSYSDTSEDSKVLLT